MRVSKPKTRAIIGDAVAEIKAHGVEPTVDDIIWLAHLAEEMVQPSALDSLDVLCPPVRCGRALLYPRTVAGDLWLEHCASKWWPPNKRGFMYALCEFFALAHGNDSKAMQSVYSRHAARAKVIAWAAFNLPVNEKQIETALNQVAGRFEYVELDDDGLAKKREVNPTDWGEEITLLVSAYKQPPRFFLYEISANQCLGMLRKAAIAIGRPELMDRHKDGDDAFGKFRLAVKEIIRKGKADG